MHTKVNSCYPGRWDMVFTDVCLSGCLFIRTIFQSKSALVRITKLDIELERFHHKSWKTVYFGVKRSSVKVMRHKNSAIVGRGTLVSAGFCCLLLFSRYLLTADVINHARCIAAGVGRAFSRVCLSVRALKGKRLELSTPNLVHMYSIAVARHALTKRSRSQCFLCYHMCGEIKLCVCVTKKTVTVASGACCCRRVSACRYDCLCFLVVIVAYSVGDGADDVVCGRHRVCDNSASQPRSRWTCEPSRPTHLQHCTMLFLKLLVRFYGEGESDRPCGFRQAFIYWWRGVVVASLV